jgi:hypothetical protein
MDYTDVDDYEMHEHDVSIYHMLDNTFIVDIKKPCGELVQGFCHIDTYDEALSMANVQSNLALYPGHSL